VQSGMSAIDAVDIHRVPAHVKFMPIVAMSRRGGAKPHRNEFGSYPTGFDLDQSYMVCPLKSGPP